GIMALLPDRSFDRLQTDEPLSPDGHRMNDPAGEHREHSIDRDAAQLGGNPDGNEEVVYVQDIHRWPPPFSIQERIVSGRQSGHLPIMRSGRGNRPADRSRSIVRRDTPRVAASSSRRRAIRPAVEAGMASHRSGSLRSGVGGAGL